MNYGILKFKRLLLLVVIGSLALTTALNAADEVKKGEALFKKLGCAGCHSEKSSVVAVSKKEISKTYAGKAKELEEFLRGHRETIIDKKRFAVMMSYINLTKKLPSDERQALVKYLLSF